MSGILTLLIVFVGAWRLGMWVVEFAVWLVRVSTPQRRLGTVEGGRVFGIVVGPRGISFAVGSRVWTP